MFTNEWNYDKDSIKNKYQMVIAMQFLRFGNPEAKKEEKEKFLTYAYELDYNLEDYNYEEIAGLLKKDFKDELGGIQYNSIFSLEPKLIMENMIEKANFSKKEVKKLLWMLVSLAYADGEFIEEEKKFIKFIANKYKIEKSILQEFIDYANTFISLETYDKEIETSNYSYAQITSIKEQIKKDQKIITQSLTRLVS